MKLIFIAGAYRAKNMHQVQENIHRAWALALEVNKLGNAYSICPHMNGLNMEGIQEPQFWIDGTLEACRRCDALITVQEGLKDSSGTQGEIIEMKKIGKPVFYSVEELKEWLKLF